MVPANTPEASIAQRWICPAAIWRAVVRQVVLGVGARVVQGNAGVAEGFFVAAGFYDVGDIRLAQVAQGEASVMSSGWLGSACSLCSEKLLCSGVMIRA